MAQSKGISRGLYVLKMLPIFLIGLGVFLFLVLFHQLCFVCIILGFGLLGIGLFADAGVWGQVGMWLLGIGFAGAYMRLSEIATALKDNGVEYEDDEEEDEED